MYRGTLALGMTALVAATACSTEPRAANLVGPWGSNQASLAVSDTGASLLIQAGGCYGSYGEIARPLPGSTFDLGGTYTQLTGAYPGKTQYAAQFTGSVSGTQMTLTVTVPALQDAIGPFTLVRGVTTTWTACLYPVRAARKR
jgi:hypothetical protein